MITARSANSRNVSGAWRYLCAAVIAVSLADHAAALVVGNQPNVVPDTSVNPSDYPGWSLGDPGWYNVAINKNFVYLGDGWVLSARHVGYNASQGLEFQTFLPNGLLGPVERFDRIPGSYYFDYGFTTPGTHHYAVSNPTSIQSETGETISLEAPNGTYFTDLQLFRIDGDPGLPSVMLPTQPLPQDFTRADAPDVVAIGTGPGRQSLQRTWYITVEPDDPEDPEDEDIWTWSLNEPDEYDQTKQGYFQTNVLVKRFGTNRVVDPHANGPDDPEDEGAIDYADLFTGVVSDTTGVAELEMFNGSTVDVIGMITTYDSAPTPGATDLEFQAQGGDSGSSVFYKRGADWELTGIIHAIDIFPNQSAAAAVYGNITFMSDLYQYNQNYPDSIRNIIETHPNYSHVGDVNLDGDVTEADMTAWMAGFGYDSGLAVGTVETWKKGDLNRDGRVDVSDYVVLRFALDAQGTGTGTSAIAFASGVPEPSAAVLACLTAVLFTFGVRRRRHTIV